MSYLLRDILSTPDTATLFSFLCFLSPQNQCVSAPGSNALRYDKLDREEIKNLLMCFLHILKSMSEGREAYLNPHTYAYLFL